MAARDTRDMTASVRDALIHLHDLPYLQLHAFARGPRADRRAGGGGALQRRLIDAIEEQRPSVTGPATARARRRHELLRQRYVEARDVRAVCAVLGLSRSEYHREHRLALDALVIHLGEFLDSPSPLRRDATTFIGRDQECELLLKRFGEARASHGQVILLEGEPGIGKSRLLREFQRSLEDEDRTWLVGRCVSYGRDIAYYPIIDLLKSSFGIDQSDPEPEIIGKIDRGLARIGARQVTAGAPFIRYLLSVDPGDAGVTRLDPQTRKLRIFEVVRALILASASSRPLVLVIEDAQWGDPLSEELLASIAGAIAVRRVLLVVSHRPVHQPRLGAGPHCSHLVLRVVSEEQSAQIVRTVLGGVPLPYEVEGLIHRKAAGNPLFIEEVTRSLLEAGVIRRMGAGYAIVRPLDEVHVGGTVQDVIMERIDRLPEESRQTIQAAAIIGREFTAGVLARGTEFEGRIEGHLQELRLLDLIHQRTTDLEPVFAFNHDVTQAVAYSSLLTIRREQLHRLMGEAIADFSRDRLTDQFEVLAYHYERGGAWREALDFRLQAADKAVKRHAIREALGHFDRAWEAAGHLGDAVPSATLIQILRGRAAMHWSLGDYPASAREAQIAIDVARREGDRVSEVAALADAAWASMWMEDFPTALALTARASEIGEGAAATAAMANSVFITGYIKGISGHAPNDN